MPWRKSELIHYILRIVLEYKSSPDHSILEMPPLGSNHYSILEAAGHSPAFQSSQFLIPPPTLSISLPHNIYKYMEYSKGRIVSLHQWLNPILPRAGDLTGTRGNLTRKQPRNYVQHAKSGSYFNFLFCWFQQDSTLSKSGYIFLWTPPGNQRRYTGSSRNIENSKMIFIGTNFHKQVGFSAVLGHEYCDNFMFPRFQVCQSHPVAIIEAGPSNVISGTDWLLEATTDPETLSKDPKWAFWPVAISKPKTLEKINFCDI